jgi:excisionase family DNA binding protein
VGNTTDGAAIATKPDPQDDDLLSLDEAAQFLGTSTTTLYRLLKQNDLTGLRVGRQWRFQKNDLLTYLHRSPGTAGTAPSDAVEAENAFFWSDQAVRDSLATAAEDTDTETKRLAYGILGYAINAGSSDIHLEPMQQAGEQYLSMRLRVDGVLREPRRLPVSLHQPLLKLFKRMGGIDPAKTSLPLEGRFYLSIRPSWTNGEHRFVIPVTCLPTTRGESIAIRLCLPPAAEVNGLDRIELVEEQRTQIRDWLHHRHGLIVTTGLGQQKQFLYDCLLEVAAPERKTVLLEEFQDYELPYAASVPVNGHTEASFADVLRAVHNHDPDVIMVETTGDAETARLVHELAFTEYLVLTAVPANSSAQAVRWFLQQPMEPLVVARTLLGVVAQWQARRICVHCKEPVALSMSDPIFLRVQQIAANGGYQIPQDATFYQGRGCQQCRNQGYLGRVDLFEVMSWNDALTAALLQGATAEELTQVSVRHGMRTLMADGICKAIEGKTTLNEVLLAGMATI